jgi:hypothetical protein
MPQSLRQQLGLGLPVACAVALAIGWPLTALAQPYDRPAHPRSAAPITAPITAPPLVPAPYPKGHDSFSLDQAPDQARSLLTEIALTAIPHGYEDTRKWGKTKMVWDGLHVRMEGLELKTKRRWKEVNQGTWKKYEVTLVEPDKHLALEIEHLRQIGPGRIAFQLSLAAKLQAHARLEEWQRGLRLLSISADAAADVELDVAFEMTTELDASKLPPDLVLKPVATAADVRLVQFKLQRVSKAHGPIIRELGDGLEDILQHHLADRRDELTKKINISIAKNSDALRLSLHDLIKHPWLGAGVAEPTRRLPSSPSN